MSSQGRVKEGGREGGRECIISNQWYSRIDSHDPLHNDIPLRVSTEWRAKLFLHVIQSIGMSTRSRVHIHCVPSSMQRSNDGQTAQLRLYMISGMAIIVYACDAGWQDGVACS